MCWSPVTNVVQPDAVFFRTPPREQGPVTSVPDLVVEVSSPSTRRDDLGRKKDLYERFRVAEYWFVDLESDEVLVFGLRGGRYERPLRLARGDMLESGVLTGFSARVDEILGPPER